MTCCFCSEDDFTDHLFFMCPSLKHVWKEVLDWIQVQHCSKEWRHELQWIIQHTKRKGNKAAILKIAIAETVYMLWIVRNEKCFGNKVVDKDIGKQIIDTIVYSNMKFRKYITILMLDG